MYLESVLVLYDVGMTHLLEDADLHGDLLLWDELAIHLLDGHFSWGEFVDATIYLAIGALPNAIALCVQIVSQMNLGVFLLHGTYYYLYVLS